MARVAVECGITTMATTPHLRNDFPDVHIEELAERAEEVRAALAHERVPLTIIQGAEASLVWALEASDRELKLASFGGRGTDLLIETPGQVTVLDDLLYQLRLKGLRITLGHPERIPSFQRQPQRLVRLVEKGILLQINAESLLGRWRSGARNLAQWLCRQGLAHVLASDGHRGEQWRPVTVLRDGFDAAGELIGTERARWMTAIAPAAVISGDPLPAAPEIARPSRRRLRLFGLG